MKPFAFGLVLTAVLGLAAVVRAEPLDLKQVPADAKWLIHVDVDAMRASILVQSAWPKCLEMHKGAEQKFKEIRDKFGIDVSKDVCKDLHGLTAYGKELGKHTGVLIVHANFDLKLAEATAAKAKDHKVEKFGSYDLHSWTETRHGHARTIWAAAYKNAAPGAGLYSEFNALVFASSVEELKTALAVLDGKAPAVGNGPLSGKVRPGTMVLARATGLAEADLPCKSPIAKQIRSLRFSMGEDSGQLFFSAAARTKSDEFAGDLKSIVEGGKALAAAHAGENPDARKLIEALHVRVQGDKVNLRWKASASDVWEMIQKHSKWIMEQHGKHFPAQEAKPQEK